ncbi:MAG: EF-P lysine aminoacylase EpmA [Patescibacteria group bacterium]
MKTWQRLKQNPDLWRSFLVREQVFRIIRKFFYSQNFHEIEVPVLASGLPAESYIEVFETALLNRLRRSQRAFLTTSPEPFLKKLLVAGIGNCYSLTKSFRNTEDLSDTHNPEFTILEWYHVGVDYKQLMRDTEEFALFIIQSLQKSSVIPATHVIPNPHVIPAKAGISVRRSPDKSRMTIYYQGQSIDLTLPWPRISMTEAFIKYAQVNLMEILGDRGIQKVAKSKGYSTVNSTWEELFHQIYLNEVVPKFPKNKPTLIYDYPIQLAALAAKPKASDPRFCERFEVYIGSIELADGCTELTDVKEQERRFNNEIKERRKKGKTEYPIDYEFLEALKLGLPKCAGIALGVDRLIMLLTNSSRIQHILFFPSSEMWML